MFYKIVLSFCFSKTDFKTPDPDLYPDPDPNWAKILDPDPNSMYLDPQHWFMVSWIRHTGLYCIGLYTVNIFLFIIIIYIFKFGLLFNLFIVMDNELVAFM